MPPRKRKHVQATFAPRGQALWDALAPRCDTARRVLLDEACRLTDRLDALDRIAAGDVDTWATIRDGRGEGMPGELVINSALSEARMTATVLRQIVTELSPAASDAAKPAGGESKTDELAKRRRERLANAAGAVRPAQ